MLFPRGLTSGDGFRWSCFRWCPEGLATGGDAANGERTQLYPDQPSRQGRLSGVAVGVAIDRTVTCLMKRSKPKRVFVSCISGIVQSSNLCMLHVFSAIFALCFQSQPIKAKRFDGKGPKTQQRQQKHGLVWTFLQPLPRCCDLSLPRSRGL